MSARDDFGWNCFDPTPPPSLPDEPPTAVSAVTFELKPPEVGWLDVVVSAGDQAAGFPTSGVFDPWETIRSWLEAIAAGEDATLSLNPEGWLVFLAASGVPQSADVRFTIHYVHTGPGDPETPKSWKTLQGTRVTYELVLDIRLPRRALVDGAYEGILASWEKPDAETFWRAWHNTDPEHWADSYDEPYGMGRYSMRSDVIDTYLSA